MKTEFDPAFPVTFDHDEDGKSFTTTHFGLTMRDYFAAKAMHAVITDWLITGDIAQDAEIPEVIARDCYLIADAMLKARA